MKTMWQQEDQSLKKYTHNSSSLVPKPHEDMDGYLLPDSYLLELKKKKKAHTNCFITKARDFIVLESEHLVQWELNKDTCWLCWICISFLPAIERVTVCSERTVRWTLLNPDFIIAPPFIFTNQLFSIFPFYNFPDVV